MAIRPDSNYIPPFKREDSIDFAMDLGDEEEALLALPPGSLQPTKISLDEVLKTKRHSETQHTGALDTLFQGLKIGLKIIPGTICALAILAGGLTAVAGLVIAIPIIKGVQLTFKFLGLLYGGIYGAVTGKGMKEYGLSVAKDYGNQSIPIGIFIASGPVLLFCLGYAITQLGNSGLKALSLEGLLPKIKMDMYKVIAQLENPG